MASAGDEDNHCLPLKFITDIVRSLFFSFSPLTLILACKKRENPYLPPEIIINILKRLRVKSLVRFQCVCKDWRNLLKSPSFITEHYHHSALNNRLLITHVHRRKDGVWSLCSLRCEKDTVEVERIPLMDSLRYFTGFIGSSNGLLCLKIGYFVHDSPHSLLLMNPATREARQVPFPMKEDDDDINTCIGFGYSPVARDYKIVRIHHRDDLINLSGVDRVEMFSLRTRSWKKVEFGLIKRLEIKCQPVSVNGVIFWLGREVADRHGNGMIVSFDLAMEVFTLIPIPSPTSFAPNVLYVYDNKVATHHRYLVHGYLFIELWVLEEGSCANGKTWLWTKKNIIRPTSPVLYPRCFWGNEIISIIGNSGFWLNFTTRKEFKKFRTCLSAIDMLGRVCYVESLASLCNTYVE